MQDEHEEYMKEKAFIGWEKEVEEKKFMQQIFIEEVENQKVIVLKSPKIVLRKSTKHNTFDHGRTIKSPRIITRRIRKGSKGLEGVREASEHSRSPQTNLQHIS